MDDHESPSSEYYADDLTWRERDILNLLAERLTNREIAERLYLAESTVKDYVGRILGKLYVKNRRQAVKRARELGIFETDQETVASPWINLPASSTPFIGRRNEIEEIKGHLKKTRLLTLSGPGGMGKTRLALKVAEEVADDFQDGSFFVSLASIRSVAHIIQSVAEAVNFPLPTHEDPKHQLLRYLRKKQLLLVMDNFEHLLDGVSIVGEILQSASGVKILTTSLEKLNLQSETNLNIGGMNVHNETASGNPEKNDAVALFLQSAIKVRSGFDPSPDELAKIVDICMFVEGMPLAIELAASWLHVLSVNEINDELRKGLDILDTEVRDAPERHRSIRAVFDRSWSLLDKKEQEIFMRLSIFRSGFTREAAQQVAGASLRQIAGLVNKSILRHDAGIGRLEIHELLRQFAQERLENTPQASGSTKEAYAAYYADFMQERWQQLRGSEEISALTEIEADIENVRTAWRYYLDEQNAQQLQKFIYGFWRVYWVRGWFRGGIELFADAVEALAQAEYDSDLQAMRAVAMASQGIFTSLVGLADEGYNLIRASIEILEGLEYTIELAFAYYNLTMAAYYLNRPAEEQDAAQSYLKIVDTSNDKWLLANGLWLIGFAELSGRNYAESKRLSEASLKLYNEINNTFGSTWCFVSLGGIEISTGDFVEAKKYFMRCLQTANELNFNWLSSVAIKYLGEIALLTNDIPEAQEYFTQSLRIAYELGLDRDIANHLYDFASLRAAQNKLEEGVELISLLLQQPASHLARAGGGLIRDRAKMLLADLENKLSQETYMAALKRGELLDIDDVVIELVGPKIRLLANLPKDNQRDTHNGQYQTN